MDAYIQGYLIDIPIYDLTEKQEKLLDVCICMIDNNWSLRETADNMNVPKSTISDFIHKELSSISLELYQLCVRQFKKHTKW